jgi:hypothetical protein
VRRKGGLALAMWGEKILGKGNSKETGRKRTQ